MQEPFDSPADIYRKFVDANKDVTQKDDVIRIITLISSKGLDADHVYILGCNDGNIPGKNRSTYLTNHEHKQEQRRLLFVGITRAKKTVTITWSRNIPFFQAKSHYTNSVKTAKINGKLYSQVGLSEFLQGIDFT